MEKTKYRNFWLYKRLLSEARPYWIHVVIIFLLSLLSTPLALLNPVPLKIAVDSVIGSEPLPGFLKMLLPISTRSSSSILILAILILLGIALLRQLQEMSWLILQTYTGEKMVLNLRARLFNHVQRLSLAYHDSKGTSDSAYRIQYDTSSIQYIIVGGILPIINAGLTLGSMIYITYLLDSQLALVAIAVSPFLFGFSKVYSPHLRKQWRQVKKIDSNALSVVQEALSALRVVKAFGQETREKERFVRHSYEGLRARIRLSFSEGGLSLLLGMTIAIGTATVLFIGVSHVETGTLTLGNLLLIMGYLSQLYGPLNTINKKIGKLQSHLASAERALSILDKASDVPERPNARPLDRALGHVVFRDVSFAYDRNNRILDSITFDIPSGSSIGIAGKTGVGKTTLISLLIRFYDPTFGKILIDGLDIKDYKLADLRNQFAIVLQEPVLFSTSIAENIAYACPGVGKNEIIEAAKSANAHDFILALPNGYETLVGERGMCLSGGERQRIALARAFLKDAPIIIMDEPTSYVDMRTEADIMEAMERLIKGRTTFMIAHRLTTLKNCDFLLVIHDGQLIDIKSDVSATVKEALELGGLEAKTSGCKANVY